MSFFLYKKITSSLSILSILFLFLFPILVTADTNTTSSTCSGGSCKYQLLAPISAFEGIGADGTIDIKNNGVCSYLVNLYKFGVYIAIGLAVMMIVIGGMQYVSTDAVSGKDDGKKRITSALQGLILALMAYLILQVVNPKLVGCNLNLATNVDLDNNLGYNAGTYGQVGSIEANGGTQSNGTKNTNGTYTGTGLANDSTSVGTGSVANGGVLNSSQFPYQSWNDYMLDQIHSSGIMDLNPTDAAKYFPNGQVTEEGYLSLFASMAKTESSFNPNVAPYVEKNGQVSLGLFGFSTNDALAKQYGYTSQSAIQNPQNSMDLAVSQMKNQIQKTGTIQGSSNYHYWGPLYRGEVFK